MNSVNTYREEIELVYGILKEVMTSPINLYTKDPELHDKVASAIDIIEYKLSQEV